MTRHPTSSVADGDRERRAARRAALRAVHPDLGGDADAFIEVVRALERAERRGESMGPTPGMSAATTTGPGAQGARLVVTTTVRSRAARRVRRTRRRLRTLAESRPSRWPGRRYGHPTTRSMEERA